MTLRHRLLLVYGIVILLSLGTVGVALFGMYRSSQIFGALQYWNDVVLSAEKLKANFPDQAMAAPDEFALSITAPRIPIARASDFAYVNVEQARESLNRITRLYGEWSRLGASDRAEQTDRVRQELDRYSHLVESELERLKTEVESEDTRIKVLPAVVATLTILHIGVIGSLLRRWLLQPLEHLTRQVEALGRDQPAPEPLLSSPQELASLAQALDRARESLGSLRRQLIESERLTAIGQFAAQIAHNLRNPLASIRAAAQVTAKGSDVKTQSSELRTEQRMTDIIAAVDRMNQWIAGLMEIARHEPNPTRQADVTPMLRGIEDGLRPELSAKELRLVLDLPESGVVCAHEPATLEHALIAMLVNAIEASPLGGQITLRARYENPNGQAAPMCRILVEDQGTGLPLDDPDRIFEVSYSTKQRGMGLGLALARQALQRQGGTAHAFNNPSGGATVYVELPAG